MYSYFNQILSKHHWGFRQGHSTQHSLLFMKEKSSNSGVSGMLLTDFSKAFDCLRHDLLTAKLVACSFDQPSLFSFLVTSQTKLRGLILVLILNMVFHKVLN